ncbi:MAG TPA: BatD family protein [Vulgatibacter sp.]|nr:BatD family protein [Vulgatibacter sp.]
MPKKTGSPWGRLAGGLALAIAALVAPTPSLAGDAIEYYASVDRDRIAVDETLTLTVTLTTSGKEPERFELPSHPDFERVSESRSEQMSLSFGMGNAGLRKTKVFTLVLRPTRQGDLAILPGFAVADGKRFETGRLTVRVGPPGTGAPQAQAPPRRRSWPSPFGGGFPSLPGLDDDFDPFGVFRQDRAPPSDADVLLRATIDRSEVYVGEQVTLTVYLMARVDVSGIESLQMPKLDGFWSEDIEAPTQISSETRTIDGVAWRFYLLRKRALFPLREGELTIDPSRVDVMVGGPFTRRVKMRRSSAETRVTVKALPPGAPAGFDPSNVGSWSLEVEAEPQVATPGAPITVRVRARGQGNLGSLELPRLPEIEGMKAFDPTQSSEQEVRRGRWGGSRTEEYVLVPSRSGSFTIPSLELPHFDPGTETFEVARTAPIRLTVLPGGTKDPAGAPAPAPADGGDDGDGGLAPLRTATTIEPARAPLTSRPWFPLAVALPPLAFFALLLAPRLVSLRRGPGAGRGSRDEIRRRLAAARELGGRRDPRFYDELDLALRAALAEVLGREVSGLSRVQLAEALAAAGVAGEVAREVGQALDDCDMGRFAPGGVEPAEAAAIHGRAAAAIDRLQKGGRR